MATKIHFKRTLDCYKAKRDAPQVLTVPDLLYLLIDGHGDPNTEAFGEATRTLYPVAYKLKFASRKALDRDYVVMPLEGLWWAEDMDSFTGSRDKARWQWTLMTMVPEWITAELFVEAVEQVAAKDQPVRLDDLRMEPLVEGLCVQALHVGPYDAEADLLQRMHHDFIPSQGLTVVGKHHEIYLSDPRRAESSKLKTILRQPVVRA